MGTTRRACTYAYSEADADESERAEGYEYEGELNPRLMQGAVEWILTVRPSHCLTMPSSFSMALRHVAKT